jgi:hypothetical protein
MPLRVSNRISNTFVSDIFCQLPALRQQFGRRFLFIHVEYELTPAKRHVTRQKILNWRQALRFPSRPRVSHEGVNLMQQLLCEPEDRLGSQASTSTSRPDSLIVQARRSYIAPNHSVDGADLIKVCPPLNSSSAHS